METSAKFQFLIQVSIFFKFRSDHDKFFSLTEKELDGLNPGSAGSVPKAVMLAFPSES